jgi:phosphoglycolate phosphatase
MTAQAALFDLDGTLVESGPSITASVRAVLADLDCPVAAGTDLTWVVGPPLPDSFARLLGRDDPDLVAEAMDRYRARYNGGGMFEAVLYPQIPATLERLRAAGWRLFVATSKPADVAQRLLAHFGLSGTFAAIHGARADGALAHKPELIAQLLATEGLAAAQTIMIGDRRFDIAGAHANKVRSIGVLWGYGSKAELETAGADALAAMPAELPALAARLTHPANEPDGGLAARP